MSASRFLVTGGSQGIGAALVELAAKAGHQVVFTGRNNQYIDAVAKKTGAHGVKADVSSPDAGAIATFTFGSVAQRLGSLDAGVRRKAVLEALAARLGPRAASPSEFIETSWWTEEWSRGCSMAHFTLGTLTRYGHLLPEQWVEARDISNVVLFLAYDEARYVTGTQMRVDLGFCEK